MADANISRFFSSDGSLDVNKVLMCLWEKRKNPVEVNTMVRLLIGTLNDKKVYVQIETFLPQFAHMTINAPTETYRDMESFVVEISKFSMFSALNLTYSMAAALEDYQPETAEGKKNSASDNALFQRCSRLLQLIERCVVEKDFSHDDIYTDPQLVSKVGWLYYKRLTRRSMCSTKGWKKRFFSILNGVLMCYTDDTYRVLKRAMPLADCMVQSLRHKKHGNYFEVFCAVTGTRYQLYADKDSDMASWLSVLNWESDRSRTPPPPPPEAATLADSPETTDETSSGPGATFQLVRGLTYSKAAHLLSAEEEKRLTYFRNQIHFVRRLTDIAERLRFVDRPLRKQELRQDMAALQVPPLCFLPICSGAEPWCHAVKCFAQESHAFSTKARCPSLVFFECESFAPHVSVRDASGRARADGDTTVSVTEFLASELVPRYGSMVSSAALVNDLSPEQKLPGSAESFLLADSFTPRQSVWVTSAEAAKQLQAEGFSPPPAAVTTDSIKLHIRDSFEEVDLDDVKAGGASDVWGESFACRTHRLRAASPNGARPGWQLRGLIAKSNDDVRQEVFVMQLITVFRDIFVKEKVGVWIHPYKILSTSKSTGLIELIPDSTSLDGLKKQSGWPGTLKKFFDSFFSKSESPISLDGALKNYIASMAGYSIVCYLLAIKDRHNGNIMINNKGSIIHIDFGFVFGLAPGKQFSMETAPWKLTDELVEVMGGKSGHLAGQYKQLCTEAFIAARKHSDAILSLMDIMVYKSNFPSLTYNKNAIQDFRKRFMLDVPDSKIANEIEQMFEKSTGHSGTYAYDQFQLLTNKIAV